MRLFLAILRKAALPTATAATASTARKLPNSLPPPIRPETLVEKLFGKYLIWTNTVSCGLLLAVGDAAAQHIETRHDPPDARTPFDWRRSGIMFAVGLTQGPVQHVFYGWLDRRFVTVSRANVAKKILLDQSFMSPVAIVQFFMAAGLLEGQTFAESLAELRSKFMTVFLSDCMFWPIVQFINFTFIPGTYRVMYVNVLTMLYNVWLSIVKHNDDLLELLTNVLDANQKQSDVGGGPTTTSTVATKRTDL